MRHATKRTIRHVPWVLAGGLVAMWLLLNGTLAAGSIVLGVVVAAAMLGASATLRPERPQLRRPRVAAELFLVVLGDIVRSNFAVARIVLNLVGERRVRSGFVSIPLELRDPHAIAVLAAIVTSTPGTVWADLSADGRTLTLHVLDLVDEAQWIERIKSRYERRLMRIFE